ncbi:hypothetical protein P9Z94_22490 [Bacillus thuringiensis]|uniref:hypothetical protein n=1 Tax=Bacillus thuringiensis TaxID=1428 RepID=UPI002DBE4945|nr:hypothetical protein [Bacillus thuringiensis]MEC3158825.1 hypothetical protein [Bacillus thuringiensis]
MSKNNKINLRIVEEIYGNQKIEEVFQEIYDYYGIPVKVRRKTPEELAAEKHQDKKYTQE